jgi:hypothetical protein
VREAQSLGDHLALETVNFGEKINAVANKVDLSRRYCFRGLDGNG